MKLPDLTAKLAEKEDLTQRDAMAVVKLIFRLFAEAMNKGERIEIRGFGSIAVRDYGGYTGRNPKTGNKVEVKPKKVPYFKVGKELRENLTNRL